MEAAAIESRKNLDRGGRPETKPMQIGYSSIHQENQAESSKTSK